MIRTKEIRKSFGTLEVLKGIDLLVERGEVVSIVGPSGAGKTTLMRMIAGIMKPTGGEIRYDGIEIDTLGEKYRDIFCVPTGGLEVVRKYLDKVKTA